MMLRGEKRNDARPNNILLWWFSQASAGQATPATSVAAKTGALGVKSVLGNFTQNCLCTQLSDHTHPTRNAHIHAMRRMSQAKKTPPTCSTINPARSAHVVPKNNVDDAPTLHARTPHITCAMNLCPKASLRQFNGGDTSYPLPCEGNLSAMLESACASKGAKSKGAAPSLKLPNNN